VLKTCGISDHLDQRIGDYFGRCATPPSEYWRTWEIHVRMTCKGEDPAEIERLLDDLEAKIANGSDISSRQG